MKEMVKVTVIATGFEGPKERLVEEVGELGRPLKPTPRPFEVPTDTPSLVFEPQSTPRLWEPPAWEKQYEPYETPTFIRRSKLSSARKHPHDLG
jgi:cell division protein FtsZ